MDEELSCKSGKDLSSGVISRGSRFLFCESCGKQGEADAIRDQGWQIRPAVCPDCLRWSPVTAGAGSSLRYERRGRFWAVLESDELLCITVYRKGAEAVIDRLGRTAKDEAGHAAG